jgi:hypothetical protein
MKTQKKTLKNSYIICDNLRQKIWYEQGISTAVGNKNKDKDNEYTEEK